MKTFEELTEVEKALRSLIYAIRSKDEQIEGAPSFAKEVFMQMKLSDAIAVANKNGIPLVD